MATSTRVTSPTLPLPIFLSFEDWASRICEEYASNFAPIPPDEGHWQDWASSLLLLRVFPQQNCPIPYEFTSWRDWASELIKVVN